MLAPVLIQGPSQSVVSLEEIKDHCRVDAVINEFDEVLRSFVDAATRHVEKSLSAGLIEQTWAQSFSGFNCLKLAVRPLASIVSVSYFDSNNAAQTLAAPNYTTVVTAAGAEIVTAYGQSWPSSAYRSDAVTVQYKVGVSSPTKVEPAIKTAILLHAAMLFENRESHSEKPVQSSGVWDDLIFPFRLTVV